MSRLTIGTRPSIAMPGFTIPPGITIRPELVLRTARRDRRGRRRPGVEARVGALLARVDRPARTVDPRIARRLGELLAGVDRPARRVDPRIARRLGELLAGVDRPARRVDPPIRRFIALRTATRPAPVPVPPARRARTTRVAVVVAVLAGVSAIALVVAVVARRRAAVTADTREAADATSATTDAVAVPPPAPAAPAWLRRFVTRGFNGAVIRFGLVGGARSPWAYLEHVGRTTGTVYRTPVLPRIAGEYACVPLPYGVDVHWARNVRAAGHCRVQVRGKVYELDEPAIISAAEHPDLPAATRGWLTRRGNRYLRLHVLAVTPGSLDMAREAAAVPPAGEPPEASALVPPPEAAALVPPPGVEAMAASGEAPATAAPELPAEPA